VSTAKCTRKRSRLYLLTLAAMAVMGSSTAQAAPDIDIYGSVDLYLNHMRSSSGANVTSMEDGAQLRSRLGLKGRQEVNDIYGYIDYVSFQWEKGLRSDNGTGAGNGFDRQSWIGLGSKDWGELRFGRQGTVPFKRGAYIDPSARTLGSMVNNLGVPSRYDNTIAWILPKMGDLLLEVQYSPADDGAPANQAIYSAGVDWASGPARVGYAGLLARTPSDQTPNDKAVEYHNVYGNYDYGQGKLYVAWARTNGITGGGTGSFLSGIGGTVTTTTPEIKDYHSVVQVAADYRLSQQVTVGGIVGQISGDNDEDATGGSLFVYYDLDENLRLYAITEILENGNGASFQPAASGALPTDSFNTGADVTGKSLKGIQLGLRYKF